jgi:hypothetical protein
MRTTAILRVVAGVAIGAMVVSAMALAGEPTAANDLIRFAEMQKKFEEARNLGLFTKATGDVLAYYYSETVPSSTSTNGATGGSRTVTTNLTNCSSALGFPADPKFLYGGLDPYLLVQKAIDNRASFPHLDSPYANFFAAGSTELGVCANFTVLSIQTGPSTTTQYVVLFKTPANKARFEAERSQGLAPMPAVGFWCMWGLGNGPSPHLASPNNPQFAVYDVKASKAKKGLESSVYIGANYWPRTHGMGSPAVLPNLIEWLDEVLLGAAGTHDPALMTPLRYKSPILLHPLERWP